MEGLVCYRCQRKYRGEYGRSGGGGLRRCPNNEGTGFGNERGVRMEVEEENVCFTEKSKRVTKG